ncbi:MAG: hypothetical protein RQ743_14370, partial [Bacteroidales bacterium]|nr:hypothetical protein [Bacteroidales bacterium]
MIIILSGEAGNGKTLQSMDGFDEKVTVLDLENRDENVRARYFNNRLIEVIPIKQIDDNFENDYTASYWELKKQVDLIKGNYEDI